MEAIQNLIVTALNSLADDIRQNMAEANENATGRTQASFEVKTDKDSISLVATAGDRAPLITLEKGVPPQTDVPVEALEEWANAKFGMTGNELKVFARKVNRKIYKLGTDRYTVNEDIYTTATKETAKILKEDLQKKITEKIKENILNAYKNG
jgi:hypothetical protein